MMIRSIAAASLTLALTGCFVGPGPGPGPGNPVIVGTGAGAPVQGTPVSPIAGGVGNIDPGTAGYIITANRGSFRFTWTGYAEFRGSIFTNPNAVGRLFPGCRDGACALASGEDVVRISGAEPGRIDFVSFPASGKRSGFDVEVLDNFVYVDLLVEGQRRPDLTLFASVDPGSGQPFQASASTMPIGLNTVFPQRAAENPDPSKKQVPAPLPASAWPEPRDPQLAKGQIQLIQPAGKADAASAVGSEALLNYRGPTAAE